MRAEPWGVRVTTTFLELGPRDTVHISLKVPVRTGGDNWTWGDLPDFTGALGKEYVYDGDECAAVVRSYGRVLGEMLQRLMHLDRFQVLARGKVTGFLLGLQEFQWSSDVREFRPAGDYLCGWRQALKGYFVKMGELPPEGTFRAKMVAQSACWVSQSPARPARPDKVSLSTMTSPLYRAA